MNILKYLPNCRIFDTSRQETNEEAWKAARNRGIGGSDIGAILGESPWTSARQIYLTKTGQYTDALEPGAESQERMYFGRLLEPVVASEYSRRTGELLTTVEASLVHKDYDWAIANIDRLIVDKDGKPIGVLECKTASEYAKDDWDEGEIQAIYYYQVQWYLWITGLERGVLACLVGGNKFFHYEIFRNDDLLNDFIIPEAKKFWFDNVLRLVEPEMAEADSEFVKNLYQDVVKGSEIVFDDDVTNDIARTIFATKKKIKELEGTLEAALNQMKDRLKEHEIGYTKDHIVKWSPRQRETLDTKALKQDMPKVYSDYTNITKYRVFTIK